MKKILIFLIFDLLFFAVVSATEPFRFAMITDLHITIQNQQHTEDLKFAINEINKDKRIEFVLVDGDDSDKGDLESLQVAKEILDKLTVPYYITSGNHDTDQGRIGSAHFLQVFGHDTFSFSHKGYYFIGFPTGPVLNGNIGHITTNDFDFIKIELVKNSGKYPIFLVTHYPLNEGDVDNRNELLSLLPENNIIAVLNGHYHRNALFNYNGIPGIVNRSTLRADKPFGGYSIYTVSDSLKVAEKIIGKPEREWLSISLIENGL
jgi:predicted phosphodiesterase